MKATGIVRRIDDLGRVVIPKEIRRTLRIREGDPLEIFTDREGEVILKKYSPIADLGDFAQQYADSLHDGTGHIVLIADQDEIVAVSGAPTKGFVERRITEHVEEVMRTRKPFLSNVPNENPPISDLDYSSQVVAPIIVEGDIAGAVVILSTEGHSMGDLELKLGETAAGFLAKQLSQ
ncbi:MAG TPA: stage V sporulation protein T [Firmicutes bacterium]|nr:stage V sporulation protein T [Bacillota bacterium]HBK61506.1 stage V sporulation protein T [Bacillota bacterium]